MQNDSALEAYNEGYTDGYHGLGLNTANSQNTIYQSGYADGCRDRPITNQDASPDDEF